MGNNQKRKILWNNWWLHFVIFVIVVITELIGIHSFQIGPGTALLLPMLYALVIGMFLGPDFLKIVKEKDMEDASPLISMGILILIAKLGCNVGNNILVVADAGLPLILQEFGNMGTLLIGMPVALLLGFRRESIGATFSQAREASLAVIGDKYGLDAPEGVGVMGVYIAGTVFGAIYNGLMGGFLASLKIFHPYAIGMACGIGSASMMSASSAAVASVVPQHADEILSFAATSNLLTSSTGLYMLIFIALPLAEKYYNFLSKIFGIKDNEEVNVDG